MGIKGSHAFVKKKNAPYEFLSFIKFVKRNANEIIYFDLFGCLFHQIRVSIARNKWDSFLVHLIKLLKHANVVVVLDGKRSREKLQTAKQRSKTRQENLDKLNGYAKKIESLSRIKKSHWMKIQSAKSACCPIPSNDEISKPLQDAGVKVVVADYEADTFIAMQQNFIVVSRDSDFMFHFNGKIFAKFIVGKENVVVFKRNEIAKALEIRSCLLPMLAVLSGSDYNSNIPTVGIKRCCKALQELQGPFDENKKKLSKQEYERILRKFLAKFKVKFQQENFQSFSNGLKVFYDLQETGLDKDDDAEYQKARTEMDENYAELSQKLAALKKERPVNQDTYSSSTSNNRYSPPAIVGDSNPRYNPRMVKPRKKDITPWRSVNRRTYNPFCVLEDESVLEFEAAEVLEPKKPILGQDDEKPLVPVDILNEFKTLKDMQNSNIYLEADRKMKTKYTKIWKSNNAEEEKKSSKSGDENKKAKKKKGKAVTGAFSAKRIMQARQEKNKLEQANIDVQADEDGSESKKMEREGNSEDSVRKKRNLSLYTAAMNKLAGRKVETQTLGVLKSTLNTKIGTASEKYLKNVIFCTIQSLVSASNDLIRRTQLAAMAILETVKTDSPEDLDLLQDMVGRSETDTGQGFWRTLLRLVRGTLNKPRKRGTMSKLLEKHYELAKKFCVCDMHKQILKGQFILDPIGDKMATVLYFLILGFSWEDLWENATTYPKIEG